MSQSNTRLIAVAMVVALSCFAAVRAADKPAADAPKAGATAAEKAAADVAGPVDGKPGASINGYRFEFPCKDPMPENPKEGADGLSALVKGDPKTTDNFTATKNFGGEKGKKYLVTLRFRGVVEPMMYKNGKQVGEYFYIGGEKNNDTYNVYQITTSSPKAHYFLNRQDKVGHKIFTIDYKQTIEIDGGATVTFFGDGQNGHLITNFKKLVVPDVAPAPKPFNGQFIQVNVVEVKEAA
jgi:hypothetical protein